MLPFFADILAPKNFKPKTQLCIFWCQNIGKKFVRKMLMKLTPGSIFMHWELVTQMPVGLGKKLKSIAKLSSLLIAYMHFIPCEKV